jgi:hypothetical protein
MLWTKNGSIPYETTDGTEGWQQAPDKPDCPEGKEVIWVAPQWIIRDPAPANREGYQWAYYLDRGWVELTLTPQPELPLQSFTSDQFANLTTEQL